MIKYPAEIELLSDDAGEASDVDAGSDLWFLPGPPEEEHDFLPPLPRAEPDEASVIQDWRLAEAARASHLARTAARLGALDDRLLRGPKGWRHRLALMEAAELGWFAGARISPDRLALWIALRSGNADEDSPSMSKVGWAFRRLSGGPGPIADLAAFLGRHETGASGDEATLGDRIGGLTQMMAQSGDLHPLTRSCLGFALWPMAGIEQEGERLEAGVTAARLAATECRGGAVFAPMAIGGAGGLRAGGDPAKRLKLWLDGIENGVIAAMRQLDLLEDWRVKAEVATADLSGRTPILLVQALIEWPLLSAPMAEGITGASRAAVQRNLTLMEDRKLVREVTGQGRFRFWRCAL